MHAVHPPNPLHAHVTPSATAERNERRTQIVVVLTACMMVAEIIVGYATGSMALLADGWHMATHVGALGFSALAYWYARAHAKNERYSFGTGKVYALSGFTSALLLFVVAAWMVVDASMRIVSPEDVAFAEALPVAVIGLLVNIVSAVLLHGSGAAGDDGHDHGQAHGHTHAHDHTHDHAAPHAHDHTPDQGHGHDHGHDDDGGADHNMRAAYMHVLADAVTSVFAIGALILGHLYGWTIVDALAAIVSSAIIARWSVQLLRQTTGLLLDVAPSQAVPQAIRERLERIDDTRVVDLHLWEMGLGQKGCIVSLITSTPRALDAYRQAVLEVASVAHLTVEIECCRDAHP
jgi:cation diffusion facilitator family transporter